MEINPSLVYCKTARGLVEVKARTGGLSVRARTLLILTNAVDSVAALHKKIGADAAVILHDLAVQGYIEPLKSKSSPAPATGFVHILSPSPLLDKPDKWALSETEVTARLVLLRREALKQLTPYFGPDVIVVATPLLKAQTLKTYNAALDTMTAKLAIYLGRKAATKVVDGLRP